MRCRNLGDRPVDIAAIEALAHRMRNAIEAIPRLELPRPMQKFPRGSCGDASHLLGALLADCGHRGFVYISGERGSIADRTLTSHAWLSRGGLVVDITADQFPDAPSAVIVAERSAWHQQFEVDRPAPADFRMYTGVGVDHLHVLYGRLLPIILGDNNSATAGVDGP